VYVHVIEQPGPSAHSLGHLEIGCSRYPVTVARLGCRSQLYCLFRRYGRACHSPGLRRDVREDGRMLFHIACNDLPCLSSMKQYTAGSACMVFPLRFGVMHL
jgi:hypothetical protein